ncbi:hypothetical protein POI8812_02870 [Pontivivens insulae]|uniref:Uncharacterized protein n=1 Tax=Pontivivens insulae TaxID=1639689 RepID=A0A2R8AE37_9RHOB|nr:hypothetical protein DFR53_2484 [Pontivivens insulae]SPF30531.1 hypothetical protein POI8812_02870 [Pontivivens insulae]
MRSESIANVRSGALRRWTSSIMRVIFPPIITAPHPSDPNQRIGADGRRGIYYAVLSLRIVLWVEISIFVLLLFLSVIGIKDYEETALMIIVDLFLKYAILYGVKRRSLIAAYASYVVCILTFLTTVPTLTQGPPSSSVGGLIFSILSIVLAYGCWLYRKDAKKLERGGE